MTKNNKRQQNKRKPKGGLTLNRAMVSKMASAVMMQRERKARAGRVTGASMGPVSAISTAPVAIGNSVRGARSVSTRTNSGVIVRGRDFMFTPAGTASSITAWCTVGGTPLSPVAFGDSIVRQYLQMYQKYRWKRCVVHYITSSPTSASGDVMFYHGKNRDSVYLNQTSSFLLPFVISDPDTVLGPQWTNHSADLKVQGTWKSTDYGMGDSPNDYADGEIFLLSKTTTTESPGYVLFDYEIEFAEMQISPRLLNLPLPRAQYTNVNFGQTTSGVTAGNGLAAVPVGNLLDGVTNSAVPSNAAYGDVYKIILDISNSASGSWTNATPATLVEYQSGPFSNSNQAVTLTDGFTLYAVYASTTANDAITFYPNATAAYANGNDYLRFAVTATITWNIQSWWSLIGSITSLNNKPNF